VVTGRDWPEQWWAKPGDTVGMIGPANQRVAVKFEWDDGTHWALKLAGPTGGEARCLWDYQAEAMTVVEGSIAATGMLAELCRALARPGLARPLLPQQQAVLDAVARNFDVQDWMTGRKLRASFPEDQEEKVQQVLHRLEPRYLSKDQGDLGDYWRVTLPGLLASSSGERAITVIEATLRALSRLFKADPDFSRFSLEDVLAEGEFQEGDRSFAVNVVSIAWLSLGGGGSGSGNTVTWTRGVPKDIERLRRCQSCSEFLKYVREGATVRAWPTAPVKLEAAPTPGSARTVGKPPEATSSNDPITYDVALSFAGEDRASAEQLASLLTSAGVKVFYDEYEQATLWGKNLYDHLHDVYSNRARFCVMFVSSAYATRLWTNHERQAAQARAFRERSEYILPIRIDETSLPGLPETIGYIGIAAGLDTIAGHVLQKLGRAGGADVPRAATSSIRAQRNPSVGADQTALASMAAKLIARAQDANQGLAPAVAEVLAFSLEHGCDDLAQWCEHELNGWHGTALTDKDPGYPDYRIVDSYVSFNEIDTRSPIWGNDLSDVLDFLAASKDAHALRILMPQPVAELDAMATRANPKAVMRWAGPIHEFFKDGTGPNLTGFFYARGDVMASVVGRIRAKLTALLISHIRALKVAR